MKAKDLKNSILQMAVEGKLVPQDPSDEPASVLLERIREEKHRLIAEGKAKFTDETFVKTMKAWKQMIDDGLFQDGAVGTRTLRRKAA